MSPTRPLLRVFILGVGCVASACAPEPSVRRQPTARASDKAALYGDAALLPTRAGERARNEVALAEEIRLAIETLHAVEGARVTVATGEAGAPLSAAVVLRARANADAAALSASATRISRAALGTGDLAVEVQVSTPSMGGPIPEHPPGESPSAPLLFGVLGLGISLGLTFDRTVGIVRRLRRRAG